MQQLVQRDRINPQQRLVACDQPFFGHLDRHPQRRGSGAFATARLQHIELPLLYGEFQVLHIGVMRLKLRAHIIQLAKNLGHRLFH